MMRFLIFSQHVLNSFALTASIGCWTDGDWGINCPLLVYEEVVFKHIAWKFSRTDKYF